jgi:AcrR family transcriptional regulator
MTTRDKILAKSQALFNKNGIGKVSVRNICEALDISLGNFTYYFPDKQRIVIELYYKMIKELEAVATKIPVSKDSILFLLEYHRHSFTIQDRYKFFYLNTFELLNASTEIREAYLNHTSKEKMIMRQMFEMYVEKGVIKKDRDEGLFDRLISISQMVNTFWIIDAEVQFKGKEKQKLLHYLELCCSLIIPHLTTTSLQDFKKYFDDLRG